MAVFPRGIKNFPLHKNLLDDVKAEHINDLQDEVIALQEVLGPLVNEVAELNQEIDQDNIDDAGTLKSNIIKFKDIAAQLLSLRKGSHLPIFSASVTDKFFPGELAGPTVPYRLVQFPKPVCDTHKSYNGYGFTAPKTGFYMIRAQANFDTGQLPLSDGYGTYSATISIDGHGNPSVVRTEHYNPEIRGVWASPMFLGLVARGAKVKLVVNQNSNRTAWMHQAYLSSICFRDWP